ncbi:hypothetical protein [Bacillus atrophaeus]|uniref:hypothetical protein n=1 Tax=Bacillus atrophaeus TaxID=1452 RepID=UPI00167115BE|nr:hypothetical protein [Bacillus atrophaeus]
MEQLSMIPITCIMNNFGGENLTYAASYYEQQLQEIMMRTGMSEKKKFFRTLLKGLTKK